MTLGNRLNRLFVQHLLLTESLDLFRECAGHTVQQAVTEATSLLQTTKRGEYEPNSPLGRLMHLAREDVHAIAEIQHALFAPFPELLTRMSFIYLVALFDAFMSDAIETVLNHRPEMLKSKEKTLSYEVIVNLGSMDGLIRHLARKELHQLGYKSIADQDRYYQDRLRLSLADSGVSLDALTEIKAARNLLVHNNGIVNEIYLESVKTTGYRLNDKLKIDQQYCEAAYDRLGQVAEHVYITLMDKFAPGEKLEEHALEAAILASTTTS